MFEKQYVFGLTVDNNSKCRMSHLASTAVVEWGMKNSGVDGKDINFYQGLLASAL